MNRSTQKLKKHLSTEKKRDMSQSIQALQKSWFQFKYSRNIKNTQTDHKYQQSNQQQLSLPTCQLPKTISSQIPINNISSPSKIIIKVPNSQRQHKQVKLKKITLTSCQPTSNSYQVVQKKFKKIIDNPPTYKENSYLTHRMSKSASKNDQTKKKVKLQVYAQKKNIKQTIQQEPNLFKRSKQIPKNKQNQKIIQYKIYTPYQIPSKINFKRLSNMSELCIGSTKPKLVINRQQEKKTNHSQSQFYMQIQDIIAGNKF